jgi:hypothetical protein
MNACPFVCDADIDRHGRRFLDRTLPKPEWTHAGHFAAALWLIRHRPDVEPERDMPGLIRAYNEATGVANTAANGYHETITLASLRAARALLSQHSATELLHEVLAALMASPLGRPDWLLAYWSRPRLFAADARHAWVDPDLQPLPF